MTIRDIVRVAALRAAFASGLASVRAQQPEADREIEQPKALYREANFAEAIPPGQHQPGAGVEGGPQ